MTRLVRLAPWLLVAHLAVAAVACTPADRGESGAGPAAAAERAEPAQPLAEGRLAGSSLAVQITGVVRAGPEVLEVGFAVVNAGAASASVPGGHEWLAATYLLDEEHRKHFYVMRDADGRPKCTTEFRDVPAGGRLTLSAHFPAPGREGGRLTIVMPEVPPFRGIPFPGTPTDGQSY